jgi:hypothetical protein
MDEWVEGEWMGGWVDRQMGRLLCRLNLAVSEGLADTLEVSFSSCVEQVLVHDHAILCKIISQCFMALQEGLTEPEDWVRVNLISTCMEATGPLFQMEGLQ